MQIIQGESKVDCYFFWRWQYIKRQKQSGLVIYFNPYEQQYRSNIKQFEQNDNIKITPDIIIEGIISGRFIYYYPDCMSYESILELDSSYLNGKGDEPIDYDENGCPIYEKLTDYVDSYCHLIAINKKTNIEVVIADIRHLLGESDKSREEAFIKSRGKKFSGEWRKDKQRAIGIWLYDYCREHKCGGPTAFAALRKTNYLERLGLERLGSEKENDIVRSLERWLASARACVEAGEVLPVTR